MSIIYPSMRALGRGIALSAALILSACGGGGDNAASHDANTDATVRGSAIKGVVMDAPVRVYYYNAQRQQIELGSGRTGEHGDFTVHIERTDWDQAVLPLVEVRVDSRTRLRCDLSAGCNSPSGHVAFGNDYTPPSDFYMLGTLSTYTGQANLSPLSHVAISFILQDEELPDPDALSDKLTELQQLFDLHDNPLDIRTPDLTRLNVESAQSFNALKQAVIGAAFHDLMLSEAWRSGNVALNESDILQVLQRSVELAESLAGRTEGAYYASAFVDISKESAAAYAARSYLPPSIHTQPTHLNLPLGGQGTLSVGVNGSGPLTYQWFKDGVAISGANAQTLAISNAQLSDRGIYHVQISDLENAVTSTSAAIEVSAAPLPVSIVSQPQSQTVTVGDPIVLSVSANGASPIRYQWSKGGVVIPGATQAGLQINSATLNDAGSYSVRVENDVNAINSNFATVNVTAQIAPVSIVSQPQSRVVTEGATATFQVQAEGGGFLNYQWFKNGNPIGAANSASHTVPDSKLEDAGNYHVRVSNSRGAVNSNTASLTVLPNVVPVSILTPPQGRTVYEGELVTLTVAAIGDAPISYVWRKDGQTIASGSETYRIASAQASDAGYYTVVVSNSQSSETSAEVQVRVLPRPSVLLSWTRPLYRTDATPLAAHEIAGYVIEYGQTQGQFTHVVNIDSAETLSYEVLNLSSGQLHARIATRDTLGQLSEFSPVLSLSIP